MIPRSLLAAFACTVFTLAAAGPARAHAQLESSDPAAGSHLDAAPKVVSLTFTEPPSSADGVKIRDGCGDKVISSATVAGNVVDAKIGPAEPGTWRVAFSVLSGADGHPTHGDFLFAVEGDKDCTGDSNGGGGTAAGDGDDDGSGTDVPWIPILIGAGVVVGGGLLLRRATS